MPDVQLRRAAVANLFGGRPQSDTHAGLWLSRGIACWPEDTAKKGKAFQQHIAQAAEIVPAPIYEAAYRRWRDLLAYVPQMIAWAGQLDGRMFIGLGGPSAIETAITISRTYGVPVIPGSAQKGLAHAYARQVGIDMDDQYILFGKTGPSTDDFDSGYVIFHDAWWIPSSAPTPLAREVVTVHHAEYYKSCGATDSTDFDSPVTNAQIAARGGFLFTVECTDPAWARLGMTLLSKSLKDLGIGGKIAAGYGRFESNKGENKRLDNERALAEQVRLPPEQRLRRTVETLSLGELVLQLGKERNKTRQQHGENWEAFLEFVVEIHGESIKSWEHSDKKNEKKAFKTVFGESTER